jgi:hypothetical protein
MNCSRSCWIVFFGAASCWGQSSTAEIAGYVTDQSGAPVADARVIGTNVQTGEAREFRTNSFGAYTLTRLIPGTYRVSVEKEGFRRAVREGIELQVGQRTRSDVQLVVGAVADSVQVVAEAVQLESQEASLGQVIENRKILDLPVNGRNVLSLAALTAGVSPGNSFGIGIPDGRASLVQAASANVLINGGMSAQNDVLIDGVPTSTCCQNQVSFIPSIDTTQEFRVRANMYDAEFGRTGGGLITFATRSGTNEFHGSVFEFLRNRSLDANNFFNNRAGIAKAPFTYNQFGARVGGPVFRNKLFFFANFEGVRNRRGAFTTGRTPTAAERSGTFSELIYDPLTTDAASIRSPFPDRRIPVSRFDPVAASLTPLYPQPNTSGQNNFISNAASSDDENQYNFRLDRHFSQRHRLFGRLSVNRFHGLLPDEYANIASPQWEHNTNNLSIALDDTLTVSPTVVVNLRYGYTRNFNDRIAYSYGTDLTNFGWPQSFSNARQGPVLPQITLAGFVQLSRATLAGDAGLVHSGAVNISHSRGRHFLKFGVDHRVYQRNENNNGNVANFSFNTGFTRGPNALNGPGGSSYASFLLGYPAGGANTFVAPFAATSLYHALYLQDDIRISSGLTLNLGIRWETEFPRTERYNRMTWFNPGAPSPIAATVGVPGLRGGLEFLGDGGRSRVQDIDWNNIAPRVGLAWSVLPRMVIRTGYGITYLPAQTNYQSASNEGFSAATSVISTLDGGRTPSAQLRNPFPEGYEQPPGSRLGLSTSLGQGFSTILRPEPVGYSQQWSFDIQREFGRGILIDAAYSGSKGTLLPSPLSFNQLPNSFLSQGAALLQSVSNPFQSLVATGPLSRPTTTRLQLLQPFPQFGALSTRLTSIGSSSYHAFQAKINKRMSSGFSVLGTFTFGKIITDTSGYLTGFLDAAPGFQNIYDRRSDRSVAPEDLSSRFVVSFVWELPFGKGRRFLSSASRAVDLLAGGWQVNGIGTFAAGQPIVIGNSVPTNSGATRPNNLGRSAKKTGSVQSRLNEYHRIDVFTAPDPFGFGSAPRTLPDVRTDGAQNVDLSVFKAFALTERFELKFQAEFFNLFNTAQFAGPGANGRIANFGTPQLGVISLQRNNPRDIQLALRLSF